MLMFNHLQVPLINIHCGVGPDSRKVLLNSSKELTSIVRSDNLRQCEYTTLIIYRAAFAFYVKL